MPKPGEQTFAPNELDNLTDAEIANLLKQCGVRVPAPKPVAKPDHYRANFKGDN